MIKLKRYDDARREIERAIECDKSYGHASQPWTTYSILCNLERTVGNIEAAGHARDNAIQLYLAYRRDGGENHEKGGRIFLWFTQALQENRSKEIESQLIERANDPNIDNYDSHGRTRTKHGLKKNYNY